MTNPTIAEILHYAADKKLASKHLEYWLHSDINKEKFSCCAMHEAVIDLYPNSNWDERNALITRIETGLKNMGCPINSISVFNDDDDINPKNQQTRYAWLKFAAKMAEEQNV